MMSSTGVMVPGQRSRSSFTTGCAFATAGVLVCGFVSPSIEADGIRSEGRVVQLTSLTGSVASPLGVLVGTLPAMSAKSKPAPVAPPVTGGPADVPAAVQSVLDSQSADESAQAAAVGVGGANIGLWFMSLLVQPLVWLVAALPPELQPIPGGLLLFFVAPVAVIIGATIDSVLNPILALFGIGAAAVAPLAVGTPIEPGGESVTSDVVETGADQMNSVTAKVVSPESGIESAAAPIGVETANPSTEPEATTLVQSPAEEPDPTEDTVAAEAVKVEPAVAEDVEAAATEPEALVEDEVATGPADKSGDVTKAVELETESVESESATETDTTETESVTAPEASTTEDRDSVTRTDAASDNTATAGNALASPDGDSTGGDTTGS